ncbi:MAG: 2-succinyl-6-hydroxy-2,4-cyclohexadiene-1-carboxylate synthase [Firmicutes bacterium ADurb.Bin080]|jgi:uncharacterized protein|nr:MAG: 2-succinyl-6-hydroxy-2,4-cyclohexadiene-1-carboxylate synthase [Firmicutes bacterium ADurb.Bin080]
MVSALDINQILYVVLGSLGGAILIIVLLYVLVSYIAFLKLLIRPKKQISMNRDNPFISLMGEGAMDFLDYIKPKMLQHKALVTEPIEVKTDDGLTLRGDFYRAEGASKKTIICMHGYNSGPEFDFSAITPFLHQQGYNLLFVNHRAHGKSDGKYIGFGVLDHIDSLKWIEALLELIPDGEIVLYGVQMGGATAMMASSLDLPPNVKAVVEDCGYTGVWDILSYQIRQMYNLRAFPIIHLVESFSKMHAKYTFRKIAPVVSVQKAIVPILFIHGSHDIFVPTFMGEANYEACTSSKEILIVEDAGHAQSYYKNPELYEETLLSFLNKHLIP